MGKIAAFGKILKRLRTEAGLTQAELSQKLNVTDVAVRNWENRGSEPSYTTLIKLADIFEVSVDYLVGRED